MADRHRTKSPRPRPTPVAPPAAPGRRAAPTGLRRFMFLGVAAAALTAAGVFGVPWLRHYLSHVSTDDAYVNGHVTYVAPRVTGVVEEVLADDNQYVEDGALLVRLDDKPFRVAVDERRAALAQARLTVDQQSAAAGAGAGRTGPGPRPGPRPAGRPPGVVVSAVHGAGFGALPDRRHPRQRGHAETPAGQPDPGAEGARPPGGADDAAGGQPGRPRSARGGPAGGPRTGDGGGAERPPGAGHARPAADRGRPRGRAGGPARDLPRRAVRGVAAACRPWPSSAWRSICRQDEPGRPGRAAWGR